MTQYYAEIDLQFEETTQESDSFHIQVNVLGAEGNPIDGAVVTLDGPSDYEDTTSNGRANFDNVAKGNYTVTAEKDGETVSGTIYESDFQAV